MIETLAILALGFATASSETTAKTHAKRKRKTARKDKLQGYVLDRETSSGGYTTLRIRLFAVQEHSNQEYLEKTFKPGEISSNEETNLKWRAFYQKMLDLGTDFHYSTSHYGSEHLGRFQLSFQEYTPERRESGSPYWYDATRYLEPHLEDIDTYDAIVNAKKFLDKLCKIIHRIEWENTSEFRREERKNPKEIKVDKNSFFNPTLIVEALHQMGAVRLVLFRDSPSTYYSYSEWIEDTTPRMSFHTDLDFLLQNY
jgi:hypothetical protein